LKGGLRPLTLDQDRLAFVKDMPVAYFDLLNQYELMQGDVLRRTAELDAILEEVHPHYRNEKNRYFLVLTQSCDLVQRASSGVKAPYIVVAPVRTLNDVLERYVGEYDSVEVRSDVPILREKFRNKLNQTLERLFNNNDPHYFYLDASGTTLESDCVAFLRLSIAFKTNLHIETCKQAKVLQLREIFQTKLGWLVGQLYSRVGTDDWDPDELREKRNKIIKNIAVWAPDDTFPTLERSLKDSFPNHEAEPLDRTRIARVIKSLPTPKQKLSDRVKAIVGEMELEVIKRFLHRERAIEKAVDALNTAIAGFNGGGGGPVIGRDVEDALARVKDEFGNATMTQGRCWSCIQNGLLQMVK
jgi:hypothetical protein